jgi:Fe-S cluster biosynthesis and repair protein YggX
MTDNVTNEELIEAIKRPDRYYRITCGGYGGESVYAKISKEAYEYWSEQESSELEDYAMSGAEDYCEEHPDTVPDNANFLFEPKDDYYRDWYDAPNEIEHSNGVNMGGAWIEITEQESDDWSGVNLGTVADTTIEKLIEENALEYNEDEFDLDEHADEDGHNYVFYGMSVEKGSFFDGVVHLTNGETFDIKKLSFSATEMPNGDTILDSISYAGEEMVTDDYNTNGKGYNADVWDY